MTKSNFILASASPRRKGLLEKAGYNFDVIVSSVDESKFETTNPIKFAQTLALAKAKDIANKFPDKLVLGADTIAECNGRIIGKPKDATEAEKITRMLFSQPHKVITGVAFVKICDNTEIVKSDITTVYPKKMSEEQILSHIAGGSWEGKAGAYAIQETGDEMVEKLDGSLTNVMGLPIEMVSNILTKLL